MKRHQRGTKEHKGGIFTKEAPIHYSVVSLLDDKDGYLFSLVLSSPSSLLTSRRQPCKVRWGYVDSGEKVRVSTRTGQVVPKPKELGVRVRRKGTPPPLVPSFPPPLSRHLLGSATYLVGQYVVYKR